MGVRILSGDFKNRTLKYPDTLPGVRPTKHRIRQSIFNMLRHYIGPRFTALRFLDAFAGSGAFGFEALSLGAAHVVFVDHDRNVAQFLRDNVAALQAHGEVVHGSFETYQASEPFDVIFLDPPYGQHQELDLLQHIQQRKMLKGGGRVILEMRKADLPIVRDQVNGFEIVSEHTYGDIAVLLLEAV